MVRCGDCGFLALRRYADAALVEADSNYRETGLAMPPPSSSYNTVDQEPVCFAQEANFREEIEAQADELAVSLRVIHLMVWNRECEGFAGWQQGFSPKEHRERLDHQRTLQWQADQEKERRDWETKQRLALAIIAGAFTILGVALGVLLSS